MVFRSSVRAPAVSGMFYPAKPADLRDTVRRLFDQAPRREIRGTIMGVISPHAGYMYSGLTAAAAFALLRGSGVERVVIVSPSHREYFGGVSAYPGEAYGTPLGTVPVDAGLRAKLVQACPVVRLDHAGHRDEHALEVQLPFLQEVLGDFEILPLVMGDQGREVCRELGMGLASVLKGTTVLCVASTDLSHYHSARVADTFDRVMIEDVKRFDAEQLMADLEGGTTEACGGGPVVAVMTALKALGANHMDVVHHCNSGDITGDTRSVVGYLSAVAWS